MEMLELKCVDKINKGTEAQYDFFTISSEYAIKGLGADEQVVFPADNELFLDIDSPEAESVYNKNKEKFEMHIAYIVSERRVPSRSGNGHLHIYVTLDRDIATSERVLYQAFLGSDPTRELLSFVRIMNQDEHPTLFIERKEQLLLGDGNDSSQSA
jgi:hypothetical protein